METSILKSINNLQLIIATPSRKATGGHPKGEKLFKMAKKLVIVESPTKAKTLKPILGKDYDIVSSLGHVRDLPKKSIGVDIEQGFKPKYVISNRSQKVLKDIREKLSTSEKIILATDPDREGEAIAWHLLKALKLDKSYSRVAFHEITKPAVLKALTEKKEIDQNLVDAQQARRILDRIVGYMLSPFLWKKVLSGLSAGRVQTPALYLIVKREKEIQDFKSEEYWLLEGKFENKNQQTLTAKLVALCDKKLEKISIKTKEDAEKTKKDLEKQDYIVEQLKSWETQRKPKAPFTTSTLQQEAAHKLRFSAKKTMFLAQQLYEGIEIQKKGQVGLITYMRTDSVVLSSQVISQSRAYLQKNFPEYLPPKSQIYKTKSKLAQEAHEAIRPTHIDLIPEQIKEYLTPDQFKLYDLIWRRVIACQTKPAKLLHSSITISNNRKDRFKTIGVRINFSGYLKFYPFDRSEEKTLPSLQEKEKLNLLNLECSQHFTEPPPRYTEATLVRALEEFGIGRPSTYAVIIETIQKRGYVVKEVGHFKPQDIGFLVSDLLQEHFSDFIGIEFTAHLEDDLDDIAKGKKKWVETLQDFYRPFEKNLKAKEKLLGKKKLTEEKSDRICDKCGKPMIIKTGRFGKFLACSNFPKCKNTHALVIEKDDTKTPGVTSKDQKKEEKVKLAKISDYVHLKCTKCGAELVIKKGKFGEFLACSNYPKCHYTKSIDKPTGIKCPKCQTGDVVERKTKRGRPFWGCSNFPKCNYSSWEEPSESTNKQ